MLNYMLSYYESVACDRGEGVIDGLWSLVFDSAILTSSSISLNRKEIQTSCTGAWKFDVVFTFKNRQLKDDDLQLGLMEVKPPRYNADLRAATKDYNKVINGLYRILQNIEEKVMIWDLMEKIVVIGIVCHGFVIKK